MPLLQFPSFFVLPGAEKAREETKSLGISTAPAPKRINLVLPFLMTMMLVSRANLPLGIESNGRFLKALARSLALSVRRPAAAAHSHTHTLTLLPRTNGAQSNPLSESSTVSDPSLRSLSRDDQRKDHTDLKQDAEKGGRNPRRTHERKWAFNSSSVRVI
jgi:hypothetical protein